MGDIRVVDWYKCRIHERQRKANTLTIEIGLSARDRESASDLAETMQCLDTAIAILERAKEIGQVHVEFTDEAGADDLRDELMEDMGHSMTSTGLPGRRAAPDTSRDGYRFAWETSLQFFS